MKVAQAAGITIGVALVAAPGVAHYADSTAGDLHRIIGPIVTAVGIIAASAVTREVRWLNIPLAVALAAASFVAHHSTAALTVSFSSAVFLVASTPFGGADDSRRGPGWRGLC